MAQVVAGHCIGTATVRIRLDRLPIGEVDDDQQRNDRRADGHDDIDAFETQRDEQRQCGFRAVGRGTERVQAEDRYAR